ncbi:hypothetical protein COLO4_11892 [Corchorus olitorius]|uniref:Leucine-rich repeat-containing N-terminal plant-type domain-containing protein n=1 Tax=Corchorus olitorius TaxID=93759 RepID=A0A1R3K2V5_9ROSI|nr:hypothetical protein COLO4_11892 [Corchorus olitorius]
MGKGLLVLSLIVLVFIKGHNGCLEEERRALLELKKAIVESSSDEDDGNQSNDSLLPSWIYDPRSDCCLWERVTCNSTTGHVIELALHELVQTSAFTNSTVKSLSALKSLESLSLRNNGFVGSLSDQDLKALGKLGKLGHIDLSQNNFKKDILKFVRTLPSLRSVDLSTNNLQGSFIAHDLDPLSNLEVLNLRNNFLNGTLTLEGSFGKLEILDLARNRFSGSIPMDIGALSSLKILSLSENSFQGLPSVRGKIMILFFE